MFVKAKRAAVGATSTDGKRKKVAEGKWVDIPKGGGSIPKIIPKGRGYVPEGFARLLPFRTREEAMEHVLHSRVFGKVREAMRGVGFSEYMRNVELGDSEARSKAYERNRFKALDSAFPGMVSPAKYAQLSWKHRDHDDPEDLYDDLATVIRKKAGAVWKSRRVPVGSKSPSGKSVKVAEGRWRPVKSREQLPKKITSKVVVPPAWMNVQYFTDPKAKLLVKGEDLKGRTQYLYNPDHVTEQAKEKFARIWSLNRAYKDIVDENMTNVRRKSEPAICLALILSTGIRPGSEKETYGKVEAFGATTLQGRHVKDNGTRLEFIGKKGVPLSISVTDPRVAKLLRGRKKAAGKEGRLFDVTGDQLLRYTKGLGGDAGFQSKDFRARLATEVAMKAMRGKKPTTMKEYKKAVTAVADKVAERLGNTRKVALSSYINPAIFEKWRPRIEGVR